MTNDTLFSRTTLVGAVLATAMGPRVAPGQPRTEASTMKIECAFGGHVFTASLHDNPTARDLASMLPIDIAIEDYSDNEKIAHLPRRLTEQGSGPFGNEMPGDFCYYAPWGNLAFFYAGYRYSSGLIRLGRLDDGFASLLTRGKFPLRIQGQKPAR